VLANVRNAESRIRLERLGTGRGHRRRPVYFIRADHIGRPVFATNSTGVKVWNATYTPFGGVHTSTGTLPTARFPGQWFQSESGLHQNWMRDYDPTTGRYLQADPLGLIAGMNVYGYANHSPMMFIDPNGEIAFLPAMLAGAAVGMVAGYLQTGCIEGAAMGALVGAGFGGFGHFIRAGVLASGYLGAGNAALSQIIAYEFVDGCGCNEQAFDHRVFWSTVLFGGLGSGLGAGLGVGRGLGGMAGGDVLEGLASGGVGGTVGEVSGYYGSTVADSILGR
jgi:RHS repeat-associated protein